MSKLYRTVFLLLSALLIISYHPVSIHGMSSNEIEVIIGYENERGKALIIEKSSEVDYQFSNLSAIAVTIDQNNLPELEQNDNVAYIENNVSVTLSNHTQYIEEISESRELTETEEWNVQLIGSTFAWEDGFTGSGVNIAIIDTGISSHSDLAISGGTSVVDYTKEWADDNGHGTHVAGILGAQLNGFGVVGVAPEANLFAVKALDNNGDGTLGNLVEAIEWSIDNEMDIINLSLGTDYNSKTLKEIMDKAYESGILIVGASGNEGVAESVIYPAKYESVIGVSAVDARLQITPFSSTGQEVEFSAPGVNIISTYLDESYGISSGTSQASPHVAGMLALLKQKYPDMSAAELRYELINYTQDLGEPGRDPLYGHGYINYKTDFIPPGEVSDIQVETAVDSISIRWTNPEDEDLQKVNLYLDDGYLITIDSTETSTYTYTGLDADTAYTFSIHTEDRYGNQSEGTVQTVKTEKAESASVDQDIVISEKKTEQDKEIKDENPVAEKEKIAESEKEPNKQVKEKPERTPSQEQSDENDSEKDTEKEMQVSFPSKVNEDQVKEVKESEPKNKITPKQPIEESSLSSSNERYTKEDEEIPGNETYESVGTGEANESSEKKNGNESNNTSEDEDKTDDDKNLIMKFFAFIGKVFVSVVDWIAGLF
ncbi:S8 family serine peptidase [Virgibacillus sp. C22-A2]|uniref:S8 family serine peptidase n=1 Tax=Virgibacillus tibetensis TaxID=3042313 RepID=A0ABU6KEB6_9BACI|nr:S8 family serine peptidase [Virgibacillus sp. C22-A2]